jgi:hypothetical protein
MAITLNQAKSLRPGQILYHVENRNADKSPQRWRVNGQPRLWKRNPNKVRVPLKHGLYAYGTLTEDDLGSVCLIEEDAKNV